MENGPRFLTETDLQTITPISTSSLGSEGYAKSGRLYRYVSFGGTTTINPGVLVVAQAAATNSTALAIAAVGTGGQATANLVGTLPSTSLVITNGATAVTANQFQFVEINVAAGGTYKLRLAGHTSAAAAGYITLTLGDQLTNTTALIPGTDTVNLAYTAFNGVSPSTTVAQPVGVTITPVPNTAAVSYYGWVQVGGGCYVYSAAGVAKGNAVKQGTGTAGQVAAAAAATDYTIGIAKEAVANGAVPIDIDLY